MGRLVEGLDGWLSTWLVTTLCVVVAAGLALLGAALWHEWGVRRLLALGGAHWTERARVYAETRVGVVRFRHWLVFGTLLLALPRAGQVLPGAVLRYCAVVWASFVLLNYPIDAHWVSRASQDAQVPHTPFQAFKLSIIWSSSSWITLAFVACAPDRYDAWGISWALAFTLALTVGPGAFTRLAWTLGWLTPVSIELQTALARQARRFRLAAPPAYVISSPRVFASCVLWPSWLVLSSTALELLAPHELVALSTYQFGWLRLTWRAKAWRQLRGLTQVFLPIACVPAFPEAAWAGVLLAALATAYLRYAFPGITPFASGATTLPPRKTAKPAASRYPLALEKAYQANWQPLVYAEHARSLYDLRVEAGPPPDYPRPQPVSRRALEWAGSLALVLAFLLGLGLADLLRACFRFR